ncbi:MAG: DEAD/DEAH box helicase, partial [Planctomycetota bacterium]
MTDAPEDRATRRPAAESRDAARPESPGAALPFGHMGPPESSGDPTDRGVPTDDQAVQDAVAGGNTADAVATAEELPPPTEVFGPDGRVVGWKGFQLSRFQLQAVEGIRAGRNVLVSAPTGAGKTLVAEYAIETAVRAGARCIYTAPIKALSNQKYRDFRDDPVIDVGLMTGDVTIHRSARVLIMTTEILRNAIFESPRLLDDVAYVVFDEVHYLDDRERGTVWEESLIFMPPKTRVIALSATVANVEELGGWMREIRPQELDVIVDERRPVPLSHWVHTPGLSTFDASNVKKSRRMAETRGLFDAPPPRG